MTQFSTDVSSQKGVCGRQQTSGFPSSGVSFLCVCLKGVFMDRMTEGAREKKCLFPGAIDLLTVTEER